MASGIYDRFKANLMNKEVDLEGDVIKVALMDTNHAFTTTHNTWSQVSANELDELDVGVTNYTVAATLGTKSVTQGTTTKWDAADSTWASATFTAYHAVIYDDTLTNDDLICSIDFGGAKSVSAGTFTIQWHTDGIITLASA